MAFFKGASGQEVAFAPERKGGISSLFSSISKAARNVQGRQKQLVFNVKKNFGRHKAGKAASSVLAEGEKEAPEADWWSGGKEAVVVTQKFERSSSEETVEEDEDDASDDDDLLAHLDEPSLAPIEDSPEAVSADQAPSGTGTKEKPLLTEPEPEKSGALEDQELPGAAPVAGKGKTGGASDKGKEGIKTRAEKGPGTEGKGKEAEKGPGTEGKGKEAEKGPGTEGKGKEAEKGPGTEGKGKEAVKGKAEKGKAEKSAGAEAKSVVKSKAEKSAGSEAKSVVKGKTEKSKDVEGKSKKGKAGGSEEKAKKPKKEKDGPSKRASSKSRGSSKQQAREQDSFADGDSGAAKDGAGKARPPPPRKAQDPFADSDSEAGEAQQPGLRAATIGRRLPPEGAAPAAAASGRKPPAGDPFADSDEDHDGVAPATTAAIGRKAPAKDPFADSDEEAERRGAPAARRKSTAKGSKAKGSSAATPKAPKAQQGDPQAATIGRRQPPDGATAAAAAPGQKPPAGDPFADSDEDGDVKKTAPRGGSVAVGSKAKGSTPMPKSLEATAAPTTYGQQQWPAAADSDSDPGF